MKKLLATMLALVMALTLCTAAWAEGTSWYNDTDTTFTINTAEELAGLATLVNSGNTFEGKTVNLGADITLPTSWTAIGNGTRSSSHYSGNAFKGTFDGNGYTISGVTGMLFGVLDGGTIQNLKVNATINDTTNDSVGAVAGIVVGGGTVSGITVSGSVSGKESVGGVVGRMLISGTVTNCVNNAAVSTSGTDKAGGIVGAAYYTAADKAMTISGCSNSGAVSSGYAAGGIVGFSAADVKNCTNTGAITANNEAGGIVGEQTNRGVVSGNNNSGNVTMTEGSTTGESYGGIVGWVRYLNNDTAYPNTTMIEVSNNTNSGTVSASGAKLGAGGIVGTVYNQAAVTGNTNTAASIAGGTFAAGIVGGAQISDENKKIDEKTITVSGNVSTTSIKSITVSKDNCVDQFVYINDNAFVEENNVDYISYIVTFDNDGTMTTETVRAGSTVTKPADPTKDGYVFEHWCLSTGDAHTAFDFENTKIDSNITLVAHWTAQSNGGTHHIYHPQPTTDTTETKAESPKTFDAGVAVYGLMAVSSVLGMGYVGRKKF